MSGPGNHDQIDVFADQPGEHLHVFGNHAVQVHDLGSQHLLAAEGQQLAGEGGGARGGVGDLLRMSSHAWIIADLSQQELGVSRNHHQQVVEVVSDAAGEASHGFHLLGLAKLLLQGAAFGDVLGEEFEEDGVAFVAESAAGEAHADNGAVVAQPVSWQTLKFLQQTQVVGQAEPLLRVGVEVGQIAADQIGAGTVAQHGDQRRIHVEQNAGRIAPAHAVGSMRDQRAKVDLGAAEAFLGITQRGVEPADESGYEDKQREMYDGPAVVGRTVRPGE